MTTVHPTPEEFRGVTPQLVVEDAEAGIEYPAGPSSVMLHMYVSEVDTAYARALQAGATSLMEPWDSFWGDLNKPPHEKQS